MVLNTADRSNKISRILELLSSLLRKLSRMERRSVLGL